MARFKRIEHWGDLPQGTGALLRETYALDFKETSAPGKVPEHAKDIAAFANAYGGTILVGARELPDGVEYIGLARERADEIRKEYELAEQNWLSPRPLVDISEVVDHQTSKVVLVVSVEPFPDQPVGAAVEDKPGKPGDASKGWRFPLRVGRHTRWLRPEQLPMMISPAVRRIVIQLEGIPVELRRAVEIQWVDRYSDRTPPMIERVKINAVDPVANVMKISFDDGVSSTRIPLDDVEAVWEAREGCWRIRVSGIFVSSESQFGGQLYESLASLRPR